MKSDSPQNDVRGPQFKPAPEQADQVSADDQQFVLSMLEADQLVAAKGRTRFGRRSLSFGVKLLLWSLRVYVIIMLLIVLVSVLRALHAAH